MRRFVLGLALAGSAALFVVWASGTFSRAEEQDQPKHAVPVGALMRAKLASSQRVLEGLVTGKCDLIKEGAKELHTISEAAEWRETNDPVYRHHSTEFRRLCEKLMRMADDGNLEGASFTYMHATTTCISCHQYVRDVIRMADEDKPRARDNEPLRPVPKKSNRPLRTNAIVPEGR